jgi:septal ring factor EnvC (AmiA/AmiB activator)
MRVGASRRSSSVRPCLGGVWLLRSLVLLVLLAWPGPLVAEAQGASDAAPAGAAEPSDDADGGEDLEALREAIAASRDRVGEFERSERDLLEVLEDIDRESTRLRAEVRAARSAAENARKQLEALRPQVEAATQKLERTRRAMATRAVALYKAGEVGPVRVLFSSVSVQDLLVRASSLRRLLDVDAALVARYDIDLAELRSAEAQAAEARDARERAVAEWAKRERELEAERVVRGELLARARNDRTRERAMLVELERAARALEEKLATLSQRGGEGFDGLGFAQLAGRLPQPVPARIAAPFGRVVDDEFGTETFRKGVEFAADAGDSVKAVAPGQVRFAGWFRGYGRIVIVDHGEGYFSVSGHLDQVFVEAGDAVGPGDTLGTVGETGSLSGPSLYFELRASGEPLDPAGWFTATGRG